MWERRAAIILCVVLSHAFIIYSLMQITRNSERGPAPDDFVSEPITLFPVPFEEPKSPASPAITAPARTPATPPVVPAAPPAGESAAITPSDRVDWPIEAKKSAARVL